MYRKCARPFTCAAHAAAAGSADKYRKFRASRGGRVLLVWRSRDRGSCLTVVGVNRTRHPPDPGGARRRTLMLPREAAVSA